MASFRNKFYDWLWVVGAVCTIPLIATLGFLGVFAVFAIVTAIQALILWVVWNWTAPQFAFVPVEYQQLGYMTTWGAVAILRIIGRITFGTIKKQK